MTTAPPYRRKLFPPDDLDFEIAFQHAGIGMGFASPDGKWVRVNRALCALLGYTEAELQTKTFGDVTLESDREEDLRGKSRLIEGLTNNFHREKRYLHKRGHAVWVQINVSLLKDANGKPFRFFSQVQDISERKLAESVLADSHENFRVLTEAVPQLVWITSADGKGLYANRQWVSYTGLTLSEGWGDSWLRMFHPDDHADIMKKWAEATQTGNAYTIEARMKKFDGSYEWWLIRGVALKNSDGVVQKYVGTCTNIDELKRALEVARESKATITAQAALIHETRDAIVLCDLDGKVLLWNPGAERLYGWTAGEAVGRRNSELYAVDPHSNGSDHEVLLTLGHSEGEFSQRTSDGRTIVVESRLTLVKNPEGEPSGIIAISADVTAKKLNEAQLLRSQRLESIGTLAGGIAHDLNNALTPIMMSIELLSMGETDPIRISTLDTIAACARRSADMVKQVLSFSRGVEGDRRPVEPSAVLRDVAKIATDTFHKNIKVRCNLPADSWSVIGDSTQIHQVLLNLCVNARDAMPDGGILTLSIANATVDEHAGSADSIPVGKFVRICVEDTGTGIAKAVLDRIFEPFFTTKDLGNGTGLGLSTSLAIIKSHSGFVRTCSEKGQGTKFSVYLPAVISSSSALTDTKKPERLLRGNGEWVLVIDDELMLREMTQETLEAFGYQVRVAGGGKEAVAWYAAHADDVSVVLTDVMMPEVGGVETIQQLRQINPLVRVIASSGLASHAETLLADAFLPKPYTTELLLQTLRSCIAGGVK